MLVEGYQKLHPLSSSPAVVMEQAEQVKQSFLDFMKQKPSFSPTWSPAGEASSALSKSSSSVVMSSDENLHHDAHQAHSSSNPCESSSESRPVLKAHDYIGLEEVSSASSSVNENDSTSDVEDTDLRLGLGPLKDDRSTWRRVPLLELELLEPKDKATSTAQGSQHASASVPTSSGAVPPPKNGIKRAFGEALGEAKPGVNMASSAFMQSGQSEHQHSAFLSSWPPSKVDGIYAKMGGKMSMDEPEMYGSALAEPPPAKDQVVGWPPIRSYRKNTLAVTHSQPAVDGEGISAVYVKVNMDGIPIGRKVDLNVYRSYESLLTALEEMFYSPSNGNCKHFLRNGVFVLTYEDKEGDWMLVGDVPWGMFVNTVRRLRIVRGSEATGLGPAR
ncbi:hypothetical protein GOP47_0017179 [Adiantum capillus-veneris]|uniref:Auxin-responsive protein n=1 Tax=Adiantum capillus-veneris TaxID=13818 RepID=A0A9D4ZBZ5_ADICA|nr:hypothetical protein GOP47_0016722 [Adiantum capillus-veneris]KAI5068834.1 hypothetical protein GOP47_0017179 [Adiantum capillus-veneris]